jgi:hypothetical protein
LLLRLSCTALVIMLKLCSIKSFELGTVTGFDAVFFSEIAKHLSLPPVKLHCSMLAEDAIKAAVKDYKTKKAKMGRKGEDSSAEKAAEA